MYIKNINKKLALKLLYNIASPLTPKIAKIALTKYGQTKYNSTTQILIYNVGIPTFFSLLIFKTPTLLQL